MERWFVGVAMAGSVAVLCGQDSGPGAVRVTVQGGGCAATPGGAIEAARGGVNMASSPQTQGYRVESMRYDVVQRQSWAIVRSCEHAERPAMAMLADLPLPAGTSRAATAIPFPPAQASSSTPMSVSEAAIRANAALPLVKAGDVVRLWKADERAHIELIGTAEENGTLGARVRIRLATPKEADGQTAPPQFLAGVVRGPANVEIER